MLPEKFDITIDGCWNQEEQLPEYSGIFFAFEAKPNSGGVIPIRLLYVGAADNVREGAGAFTEKFEHVRFLRAENLLCFKAAAIEKNERERILAAFIYIHKPPVNEKYKYRFPFETTRIRSHGEVGFLKLNISV